MSGRIDLGFLYELPEGHYIASGKALKKENKLRRILNDFDLVKTNERAMYDKISDDYDLAGNVQGEEMDRARLIHSQYTFIAAKKMRQKIKFPSFDIKIVQKVEEEETREYIKEILRGGTQKLLEIAKIPETFDGKGGIKFRATLYGDSFFLVRWDEIKKCAVWEVIPFDNIFLDVKANAIRNAPDGMTVSNAIISYDFDDWDIFVEKMLDAGVKMKDLQEVQWGNIPTTFSGVKGLEETGYQYSAETGSQKREGQMMVYFDLENEKIEWYAGINFKPLKTMDWEVYLDEGEGFKGYPILPIFNVSAFERSSGLFSFGIGHLNAERNTIDTLMRQSVVQGAINSATPLRIMEVKQNGANNAETKIANAIGDLQSGEGAGIVVLEKSQEGVEMSKIQNLFAEQTSTNGVDFVNSLLQYDLVNIGINTRDVSSDPTKTAFAVREDNIASSELATEFLSKNIGEIKLALDATIVLNRKRIQKDDKRIFKLEFGFGSKNTLGDWAESAKNVDFEIDMTGDIRANNTAERENANQLMQIAAQVIPNTRASKKIVKNSLAAFGVDVKEEDMAPEQPQQPQQGQPKPQLPMSEGQQIQSLPQKQ